MDTCIITLSGVSMGTEFQVCLCGQDPEHLRDVGNYALEQVETLEAQWSHYRLDSDICDLNQFAAYRPVILEPGLFGLLERAVELSRRTEGAFDITAGSLIKCWGFFRGRGALPTEEALAEARERVGSRLLELDREARTVRFLREGVEVHLGAFGKGLAVDAMVDILREYGVSAALVHGGTSTVYGLGRPPGEEAWEVGLCDPRDRARRLGTVRLRDRALSTSGDYEQFFEVDGQRYSHVLDPRTGRPARGMRSATVVGESAADTDALSTASFVLGLQGTERWMTQYSGMGAVLVPEPEPGSQDSEGLQALVLGQVEWERAGSNGSGNRGS